MDDGILPRSIMAVASALPKGTITVEWSPGGMIGRLILIIFLILIAGFFAGAETALAACNKLRIRQMAENGDRRAKIACRIFDNYDSAIVVILIATNIAHVLSASAGALLFISLLGDVGSLISTVIITLFVFVFADTIPKNVALVRCDSFMLSSAYPLYIVMKISVPISAVFTFLSRALKKRLARRSEKEPIYTDDELSDIVETVEEEGGLEHEESSIIRSAIEFGGMLVKEACRPIDEVFSLSVRTPKTELLEKLLDVKYSRIPLYRDNPRGFIGFLRAEDYLVAAMNNKAEDIRKYISPALYVFEDEELAAVFEKMVKRRCHLAFVRSFDRKTVGILTMEDLLERIVGEINDSDDSFANNPSTKSAELPAEGGAV